MFYLFVCLFVLCIPPLIVFFKGYIQGLKLEYLIEKLEVKFYLAIHYVLFLSFPILKSCLLMFLHLCICACMGDQKRVLGPLASFQASARIEPLSSVRTASALSH